ncbi:MAG: hypothetical protein KJ964_05935 [Verrucomicrobia bacterium]|nr:hypothetical protein [Verrucomicrobiota bacterium]MBU1733794.1 hypothetical protein [Verrucomicrobiota bacterium]MBU1856743.1 hypothetical protein [Verrucomicrobiota bacterium]
MTKNFQNHHGFVPDLLKSRDYAGSREENMAVPCVATCVKHSCALRLVRRPVHHSLLATAEALAKTEAPLAPRRLSPGRSALAESGTSGGAWAGKAELALGKDDC